MLAGKEGKKNPLRDPDWSPAVQVAKSGNGEVLGGTAKKKV